MAPPSKLTARAVQKALRVMGDEHIAVKQVKFFKTAKGQYAQGDKFLGLKVPQTRAVAKDFAHLPPEEISLLLYSEYHEERLIALIILVEQCRKGDVERRRANFEIYLRHTDRINNWDLVDVSARTVVGDWLLDRDKLLLHKFARSESLWERRIAIVATHAFIARGHVEETLRIAKLLLPDPQDLIHKAVGWMLREVGKKNEHALVAFLAGNHDELPRTTLRYAIERFPASRRAEMLKGIYASGK